MKIDECSDLNHHIRAVAEIEADFNKLSKRYFLAFSVTLLVCITGVLMTSFIHGSFEQNMAAATFFCAFTLAWMIITIKLPTSAQYTFVSTKEMVSICEKVERYPELREALCQILSIRPVLTKAEYVRFALATDKLTTNEEQAADKLATEEAWAAVQKRLRYDDITS